MELLFLSKWYNICCNIGLPARMWISTNVKNQNVKMVDEQFLSFVIRNSLTVDFPPKYVKNGDIIHLVHGATGRGLNRYKASLLSILVSSVIVYKIGRSCFIRSRWCIITSNNWLTFCRNIFSGFYVRYNNKTVSPSWHTLFYKKPQFC